MKPTSLTPTAISTFDDMKAIQLHARGGADMLVLEDAPLPVVRDGDVLVKVLATGITRNELDWEPTYVDEHWKDRTPSIPGQELCGIVTQLGPGVTDMAVGSMVYGLTSFFRDGAAAEYIATAAAGLALKPESLDAVGAAAVPLAALTAWQALFDHGDLQAGQHILIHGAAGGVGVFAVQIAVWRGARVTGTAGASSLEFLRSLGVEEAIDYRSWPAGEANGKYDMVLDCIGGETRDKSWALIRPGGILVSVAEEGEFLKKPLPVAEVRGDWFIVKPDRSQLQEIGGLIDAGKIRPVVGDRFPLHAARQAYEKLQRPGRQGKIVLYL